MFLRLTSGGDQIRDEVRQNTVGERFELPRLILVAVIQFCAVRKIHFLNHLPQDRLPAAIGINEGANIDQGGPTSQFSKEPSNEMRFSVTGFG